ncbi:flavin-binding protein dodecin [Bradyrhizobium diazoefficiens]
MPTAEKDHVYKILELVGSSETSIEDAIKNAVSRAAKTIREMKWFEVVQTRRPHREQRRTPLPGDAARRVYAGGVRQERRADPA